MTKEDHSPLIYRLGIEIGSAFVAAFSVAPFIGIIDRAIVSNASGLEPLSKSLRSGIKMLTFKPVYFMKQRFFLLIFGVQIGTYSVANLVEAICERMSKPSQYPKSILCSMTNVTLSVAKDSEYVRMFGKSLPHAIPISSLLFFAKRDSMTVFSSFILPDITSKYMVEKKITNKLDSAYCFSQLMCPVSMQLFSTPLHLFGLDLYNRPNIGLTERFSFIKTQYVRTAIARMSRILPAFGIGGIINRYSRIAGKEYLDTFDFKKKKNYPFVFAKNST